MSIKKSVVLAEKPSVGRDIARVLGCTKKNNGYYESNQYIVTWALGHLVTLASPEKYNQAYSNWTLETLPMIPKPFKLEVIGNTSKQFSVVRKLMERGDVSEIIIATDAGREGELVARWIIDYARCKKPIKRLWISSVTDKAIKDGFNKLVDGKKYEQLYKAAKARAEADWIVGLNGTRALTCKHNASLSMGRVQTPTLDLVSERERVVRHFVPQTYIEIEAMINGITCRAYDNKSGSTRFFDRKKAGEIYKQCLNQSGHITKVNSNEKKSHKAGFYDLTELQRDANTMYGFSAKETLNTMQTLYERHKVLTYPRTDSKYITQDVVGTLPDRLRACKNGSNSELVGSLLRGSIKSKPSFANDAKVGDHHGIIPTEVQPRYADFSPNEKKIYNLVVQRFIAALLPAYRYQELAIEAKIGDISFKGKSKKVVDIGWKAAYQSNNDSNGNITNRNGTHQKEDQDDHKHVGEFVGNQKITPTYIKQNDGKTAPPNYLSEADLLYLMEESGLGTVATRADIIEKIVANHYVDKISNHLRTTKTGRQLLKIVPEDIKSKELTSKWEEDLELIAKGKKSEVTFINEMIEFTKKIIKDIKLDETEFKHENVSTESCPDCGKKLLVVNNKYGKKLSCPDRSCGYRKNLSKTTNARCPDCHKKMELIGEGDKQTFICGCGHKEKLAAFQKRREASSNSLSKSEVQKYMKKSDKKEETFNNPFANLLKDIDKK
ncbi:MAG: DNA topoisomerase III [Vallitaleaceae bacterium]|jgi:DNA topoisomerase-3|nr:DNA topoisomerase III [Vallitaleaceae bacterium]